MLRQQIYNQLKRSGVVASLKVSPSASFLAAYMLIHRPSNPLCCVVCCRASCARSCWNSCAS